MNIFAVRMLLEYHRFLAKNIYFAACMFESMCFLMFQVAPYERPALSKAYLFPEGEYFHLNLLVTN